MRKPIRLTLSAALMVAAAAAHAADYAIDTKGAHAFIQFHIKHLGYSWLVGRFNTFDGEFSYDENNPQAARISVNIDPASVDSNHAERDKHLRSDDFFDVERYPEIRFTSTRYQPDGAMQGMLYGNLTMHGVTTPVVIKVTNIGEGEDPWGGYRRGFYGTTSFKMKDFNIKKDLGPASQTVELMLGVEGIRQ